MVAGRRGRENVISDLLGCYEANVDMAFGGYPWVILEVNANNLHPPCPARIKPAPAPQPAHSSRSFPQPAPQVRDPQPARINPPRTYCLCACLYNSTVQVA